jgi:hypothetical protein
VIKRKLDNYAFIKCNLKLKIIINASPFYYGVVLVSYKPLPEYNPSVTPSNSLFEFIPLSQRPHIYLYPQNCQGGSMTLPFIYNSQWLPTTADGISSMGLLSYNSFYDLLNANSVAGSTCDISFYAWADDVEVAGPTTILSLQSTGVDEYSHAGTISKPASAMARMTGSLSKVPVIGPFMTATSMGMGAISNIASLFGYTNVPVIDDVHYFKNTNLPHLAATDIGNPVDKLSVDSKNELSIDPSICGVSLSDELNIATFCGRESYVAEFNWASTKVPGDGLYNWHVLPNHFRYVVEPSQRVFYTTPSYMVSICFKYWRGDVIYRLKFICTQYHKGRVEISWSPTGYNFNVANSSNQIYTQILDITETTDVEFRVPYLQSTAYPKPVQRI